MVLWWLSCDPVWSLFKRWGSRGRWFDSSHSDHGGKFSNFPLFYAIFTQNGLNSDFARFFKVILRSFGIRKSKETHTQKSVFWPILQAWFLKKRSNPGKPDFLFFAFWVLAPRISDEIAQFTMLSASGYNNIEAKKPNIQLTKRSLHLRSGRFFHFRNDSDFM